MRISDWSSDVCSSDLEGEAQLRLAPHELLDQLGRLFLLCAGILVGRAGDGDPQQRAPARVHGGFLELLGQHLAEALEAAHLDLAAALEVLRDAAVLLGVVHGIDAFAALGEAVARLMRRILPAAFDWARPPFSALRRDSRRPRRRW